MKHIASILLLICYLGLGTGSLEYLHNLQHAAEDAREDAHAAASGKPAENHQHDDSNCQVHAQLHLAFFFDGSVLVALSLSLSIAILLIFLARQIPRLFALRITCRGPPICSSFL